MSKYSVYFHKIFSTQEPKTSLEKSLYELIYELNADQSAILLLYLFQYQLDTGLSDDDMLSAVNACISYVFRVRIFKGSVSNQFFALAIQYFEKAESTTSFMDRIWDALTSGQGTYRFPKDREFKEAMENKDMYLEFKPQMLRYILYKYERAVTKEVVIPENVTIEHIMPQNIRKWQKHLIEIGDTEYGSYINRIGNLTLTKYNSEASNDPFEEKKQIYKNSGYSITREIAKKDDWTSKEIRERSHSMAEEAVRLWPLPENYNKDVSSQTWQYNVMDDKAEELFESLTSSILEYNPSFYEEQKKLYVNYMYDRHYVLSVIPLTDYLQVTFNAPMTAFTPNNKLEDISDKGHWGVGSTRMKVENDTDVWQVLEYIQQMTERKGA